MNTQVNDLKIRMPETFDKLESFCEVYKFEWFHNLYIDVINAEIKALHHSAFLCFKRKEIKDKLYQLLGKFTEKLLEHRFVEKFCELFKWSEKLRRIRMEIARKEYTSSYSSMLGLLLKQPRTPCFFFVPDFFFQEK